MQSNRWQTLELRLRNALISPAGRKEKISREIWLLLAAIVVFFAVLQLALRYYEPGLARDSVGILKRVTQWHRTGVYADGSNQGSFVPPLALYCFRLPLALNLPLETGILALNLLLGMAVPPLFFLTVREMGFSNRVALVAALLMASNPYLHDIYNSILRDPVFIPLALLALLFILRSYKTGKLREAAVAGLLSALAFLTRYEGIMLPAVFAAGMAAVVCRDKSWRRAPGPASVFLVCWATGVCLPLYLWGVWSIAVKVYLWRFANIAA